MHLETDVVRRRLIVCYIVQQRPGRRLAGKAASPRMLSSENRKRAAKKPASLHLIIDDMSSNDSKPDDHMRSEELPSHDWLHELDALTASQSPTSNTTTDDAPYFCAPPLESSLDTTETYIEQLAKLVIAIGRSVSILSSPARTPSISVCSPPFNDICASASSLIMITTQVSQPDVQENELDISMPELDSHLNAIPDFDYLSSHPPPDESAGQGPLPDPGTLLMILACYQQLLVAFETICLFMQQRLHEMAMNSLIGFSDQRRSRATSPQSSSPPSDTLQFIMLIKLTSDLVSRLDRALVPLVGCVDRTTSCGLSVAGHPCPDMSSGPASSSSSSSLSSISTARPSSKTLSDRNPALRMGDISTEIDRTGGEVVDTRSTSRLLTMKGGEQLRQQQCRLRTLIKVVKNLVRSQEV